MTREQAINSMISHGFTVEQAGEIFKAVTPQEPTTKNDLGVDCIDRAELLKAMDTWDKFGNDPNEGLIPLRTPALQDRYVPYVKYDDMVNCVKGMPSVTPQEPRWIPCSERLPNWDINCLVTDEDGEYGVGYYREDVHAWDSPNWGWLERKDRVDNKEAFTEPCGIGKVIAWMPLPQPYREVKE